MNRKYQDRVAGLKSKGPAFKDVHPSPTAGRDFHRGEDQPLFGAQGQESRWIRCMQCGFPIDRTRHQPGSGWGNTSDGRAGCPHCKSSNYDPENPAPPLGE